MLKLSATVLLLLVASVAAQSPTTPSYDITKEIIACSEVTAAEAKSCAEELLLGGGGHAPIDPSSCCLNYEVFKCMVRRMEAKSAP